MTHFQWHVLIAICKIILAKNKNDKQLDSYYQLLEEAVRRDNE